uniref:Sec20 C-terminal domain-containing protein n=1 Tax=Timema poppense TaxID=170557 RepID=A0A7R9GYZ5_TIMPO|nr:unnamed protein product [Timema poppensis]
MIGHHVFIKITHGLLMVIFLTGVTDDVDDQAMIEWLVPLSARGQDINHCTGPLELLNELNCEGRTKLAALRKHIDRLEQKKDKKGLVKISSNVTEQLLSISRHLADTTQRSADTLDSLANSSGNVQNTQQELLTTGSVITQSGKLLDKYGRREFTDKVLLFFAFAFFLACVVYIVQKRIF